MVFYKESLHGRIPIETPMNMKTHTELEREPLKDTITEQFNF